MSPKRKQQLKKQFGDEHVSSPSYPIVKAAIKELFDEIDQLEQQIEYMKETRQERLDKE